jgi:hypothetical protein
MEEEGNLCLWCEKERTSDKEYWMCDTCSKAKEQKKHEDFVFHLPGNP